MEVLLIDTPSPPSTILNNENFKVFFNLLGLMEKVEEMATNLPNKSFSYSLITISNVLPNHINFANATCNTIDIYFFAYMAINWYSSNKFYRIMIDTGTYKHSTASYGQFMVYIRDIKYMTIDISKADVIYVQFGISSISSMGSVLIQTPIRHIKFHIVKADNLFLLCFVDIDYLGIYFKNIDKFLVIKSIRILVIRRFDHPFLLWKSSLNSFITQFFDHNSCYLTEMELRQLHRRFRYFSTMKLRLLLEWAGYEINKPTFDQFSKYCTFC